jgi:hypothetical protein
MLCVRRRHAQHTQHSMLWHINQTRIGPSEPRRPRSKARRGEARHGHAVTRCAR